jgi:hypothetical protein
MNVASAYGKKRSEKMKDNVKQKQDIMLYLRIALDEINRLQEEKNNSLGISPTSNIISEYIELELRERGEDENKG